MIVAPVTADPSKPRLSVADIARGLSERQCEALADLTCELGSFLVGWRSGCSAEEESALRDLGLIEEHWTWASTTRPDTGLTELGLAVRETLTSVRPVAADQAPARAPEPADGAQ